MNLGDQAREAAQQALGMTGDLTAHNFVPERLEAHGLNIIRQPSAGSWPATHRRPSCDYMSFPITNRLHCRGD